MSFIAAGAAIIGVAGSIYQSNQAGHAADAQVKGNNAAIAEQRRQFDLIMGMLQPQQQLGQNAIGTLNRLYGYPQTQQIPGINGNVSVPGTPSTGGTPTTYRNDFGTPNMLQVGSPATAQPTGLDVFQASPDYQFRRAEGNRDINNSFAARGGALSGNALRGITDYNSNLASGEFNNFVQRQLQMAGLGGQATSQGVGAAQNTGNNVGNALINSGNARASGIANQTNTWTNLLNQFGMLGGYGG
jgi:hypothetical protein